MAKLGCQLQFTDYLLYRLSHREISQLDHRENKAYTLGLSQLLVFIAVAMNTDGFFSYKCLRFIFLMIELRIFSVTEPVLYLVLNRSYLVHNRSLQCYIIL